MEIRCEHCWRILEAEKDAFHCWHDLAGVSHYWHMPQCPDWDKSLSAIEKYMEITRKTC